ncbi:YheC/YheD family endospore coat-associated protein [Alteribacillus bidgolensis]|uniref:YheC/YheD family endospore coat-associated protein n=1 Tax=Alteribacillus bidgolensis TaxID=930129 RepID=UPI0014756FB6|nr:YheC/YheD family protein [Alteribacillus bidgolensis]
MKKSHNKRSNKVYLPEKIVYSLGLEKGIFYNICVGQLHEQVFIEGHKEDTEYMYVPNEIFHNLLLLSNLHLNIWVEEEKTNIYLGPVVGVFVNTKYMKYISKGEIPFSLQKHMEAGMQEGCLLYYFSINDIKWFENKVKGYIYAPKWGKWLDYWLPLSNVIYDRGVGFQREEKPLVKHIRNQFTTHPAMKLINNCDFLGKWKVHKLLYKYNEVKQYLPHTITYKTFDKVIYMLEKYQHVFLKSFYGSRGIEVMSIEKSDGGFILNFYNKGLQKIFINNESGVKSHIDSFVGDKPFIIQQGIPLIKLNSKKMDLRVLIQKNDKGKWKADYCQIRLAQENYSITNENIGGRVVNYRDYYDLLNRLNNYAIPTEQEIYNKTIKIATYIEKEFGTLGELGMDMAIDDQGGLWFIEANSKPDKDPVPGIDDTEEVGSQFIHVLKYAKFLTCKKNGTLTKNAWSITLRQAMDKGNATDITLPKHIYEKLEDSSNISFKAGSMSLNVSCIANETKEIAYIPKQFFKKMTWLQEGSKYSLRINENQLCIGPVIGVFISSGVIRKLRKQNPIFRQLKLIEANKKAGTVLYFFSLHDVDFIRHKILGTYFNTEKRYWETSQFPLPDVLYDRGGGVLPQQQAKSDFIREQLEKSNSLKKLNTRHTFDKWDLHQKLTRYKEISNFIPKTMFYRRYKDLREMFKISNALYMKDCYGNNGKGVMQVIKLSKDKYKYSYISDRIVESTVSDIKELVKIFEQQFDSKKFIIQEAINVLKILDCPVDMRATVQKNREGKLDITSYPVRVGKRNAPLTSTRTGSKVHRFEDFFEKLPSEINIDIFQLKNKIDAFLLTTYECMENAYGDFGELGIDFALDHNFNIWLIECNAKPGYNSLYKSYDKDVIKRVFLNPLQYAKYISDFKG